MKNKISKKRFGFTLVEMLIVIVIIGILAAALIPRLGAVRGKARDAGRKAAVAQAATAMQVYGMDYGTYLIENTGKSFDDIAGALIAGGMEIIPVDKNPGAATGNCKINNISSTNAITGYGYISIRKTAASSDANKAFVMRSCPESAGSANRVMCGNGVGNITGGSIASNIYPCTSLVKGSSCTNNNTPGNNDCTYTSEEQVRYIFVYPSANQQ